MGPPASTPLPASGLDEIELREALRYIAVAVATTAALWHGARAAALPGSAHGPIAAAAVLGLAQLAWAAWLALAPSRRCLVTGAAGTIATTVAAGVLLWSARGSAVAAVPLVLGVLLQLTLLVVVLTLAVTGAPRRALKTAIGTGAVAVAVLMSVLVAGGTHDHAATAARPSAGAGAVPFVCHLI